MRHVAKATDSVAIALLITREVAVGNQIVTMLGASDADPASSRPAHFRCIRRHSAAGAEPSSHAAALCFICKPVDRAEFKRDRSTRREAAYGARVRTPVGVRPEKSKSSPPNLVSERRRLPPTDVVGLSVRHVRNHRAIVRRERRLFRWYVLGCRWYRPAS